jgi:sterol desaturase/sphingolipid hydroxylase (fatty acid hydroxylase superfamily)
MFKYGWMEMFSKVHYSVPLIIYIPVIGYFLYQSIIDPSLKWLPIVGLFAGGVVMWTITEYFLHRFVFHYHPTSAWGKRRHFIMHGVHHDYPNDSKRLVLPPSVSIPLAFLFYYLFLALMGVNISAPFYAGFVTGYLIYDMIHYAVHHANIEAKWFIRLKTHHLKHHFKDPDSGFGVSTIVWDKIVGTDYK